MIWYYYNNLKIKINNQNEFNFLSRILEAKGDVEVIFEVFNNNKKFTLKLKNKRFVDKNILNSIKNQGILATIFWKISCLYLNKLINKAKLNTHTVCGFIPPVLKWK